MIRLMHSPIRSRSHRLLAALAVGLIVLAGLLLSAGCRSDGTTRRAAIASGTQSLPRVTATPLPSPEIDLSSSSVPQGGAFAVRLRSSFVSAAITHFNNQDFPMVASGDLWYAIIGAGQAVGSVEMLPAGDYSVAVTYQFQGESAVHSASLPLTISPTSFPVDAIQVSDQQALLLAPELEDEESAILKGAYGAFTPRQLWQGRFTQPVQGPITTVFGARRSYQGGPATGSHAGIDIAVPLGTPVAASAAGRVAWTGQLPDRGNGVIVDHGLGVFSGYFHLSAIKAQVGQSVNQGDVIGLAGSTGLSTGPHVHWEIVVNGINVDGLQWAQLSLP
jgi:murein DD-endopeptidase MepM/ murein hydrolase activator NlpD